MKIVNPLYDLAFKYLMENNKLAKKVLSIILDLEVEKVTIKQQETTFPDERRGLTLFRLDFKADIKEADGTRKTVLIELQKSKYSTDIQRFRNYLGQNYLAKRQDQVAEPETAYITGLPIITVYILGYNLDDLPYLAVTVNNDVINSVNKKKINVKSFFVEHLTHRSHILQVRRLPEKRRTKLEKFLTFFNQAWCSDKKYIIDLQDIPEDFKDIARHLQSPLMDDAFRRQLEAEEELDTIFDEQEAKYLRQIAEALDQKEAAEKKVDEERSQKEEERRQREAAEKKNEIMLRKLVIQMHKHGASIQEIAVETGLSNDEVEGLLR